MKTVCLVIVAVLASCALASVERRIVRDGSCGKQMSWTLDCYGHLVITGSGEMYNYSTSSKAPWYPDRFSIVSVEVGSGVQSIGAYAFYDLYNLTSVSLPATGLTNIYNDAFSYCTKLTEVSLPNTLSAISNFLFSGCKSLKRMTISEGVKSIGSFAFNGCKNLVSVTMPNTVKSIGSSAFAECSNLGSLTLPVYLNVIGDKAFEWCSSLTEMIIPYTVRYFGSYAFSYCISLVNVSIHKGVTSIGDEAFAHCYKLNFVYIPDSMATIGKYAFYRTNITSLYIPANVTSIGTNAFYRCHNLASIAVNSNNSYYSSTHGILFNHDSSTLIRYPPAKTNATYYIPSTVKYIGRYAFASAAHLKSVSIPNTVQNIPHYAFYYCERLVDVSLPETISTIGLGAFSHCYSLENINIPNSVTAFGDNAFSSCYKLDQLNIPPNLVSIGAYAFYHTLIPSIRIPASVTSIGIHAFYRCSKLQSIEVVSSNQHYSSVDGVLFSHQRYSLICYPPAKTGSSYVVPSTVTQIRNRAFSSCTYLSSVTIPDNVRTIEAYAFFYAEGLTSVSISNAIRVIEKDTFSHCVNLKKVNIPENVTKIDEYAFGYCKRLEEVDIPESVTYIGNYSFAGCTALRNVYYEGSHVISTPNAFYDCLKSSMNVCVPPEYPSGASFCGVATTPTASVCQSFRSLFNACYKGVRVNDKFEQMKRMNATAWEAQTNGCVEYQCDNVKGPVYWSLCNSTGGVVHMCLNDKCVTGRSGKGFSVEIGIGHHGIDPAKLNMTRIIFALVNLTGLDEDSFEMAAQVNEEGLVVGFVVTTREEEFADVIADAVETMDKGDDCHDQYDALCFADDIRVLAFDSTSGAYTVHSITSFGVVFMTLLFTLFKW